MEIRVLNYFLTVAREESITKAAEVLHITQPTLSRQLSQMEEEMGVKLFERGTRKIRLTNEGILLRRRAEEILQLVEKTEQELVEQEEQTEGTVTVGLGELASVQLLPDIFKSFHKTYPRVRFELFTATADVIKEQMDKGLIDVGLLLEPVDIEKYDFIRLKTKEKWVAVMQADDPLSKKKQITPKDLAGASLIFPLRPSVRNELSNWFGSLLEEQNILFTSNLSTNASILVSKGLAYSFSVEGALPFLDSSRIVCRPLSPELSATSVLAWKRKQPHSLATTRFIERAKCLLSMNEV